MTPNEDANLIQELFPWVSTPPIISAPMRGVSGPELAVEVSKAGGLGFIGPGLTESSLELNLIQAEKLVAGISQFQKLDVLPIGVGFIVWDSVLEVALNVILKYRPSAVWLFAAREGQKDFDLWINKLNEVSPATKIFIQLGSVTQAIEAFKSKSRPDLIVVQGSDAGGHGLKKGCGLIPLLLEIRDKLDELSYSLKIPKLPLIAAGGIAEGRGVAASLILGASGVAMGTRFLASNESLVAQGYKNALIEAEDGGQNTKRTFLFDQLRGTTGWPKDYNGRSVINQSVRDDELNSIPFEENKKLYEEALAKGDQGWGFENGRLTTFAGAEVGLIKKIEPAAQLVFKVREDAIKCLHIAL
ncbi:hypothetical protein PACTADRAFT_49849 [Pachysolen tannophilus NRRL Y-2460]|uniref:Uncharacterized protein n=1 Tax=Pachysolen tannophilus NRRL Y-2460 TaxID=669874 RepID=A0A1E4TXR2_PACTA|nr:hypothetical protein PACTADRAFT_49849 [Pachysolen tannophilus NRRL Y-2460]